MNLAELIDIKPLLKTLDITLAPTPELYNAFVHRSFVNEYRRLSIKNNERLEFLGDAVLELVITEALFKKYPKRQEGVLTNWRSALVKTESLALIAKELKLNEIILMSKGEERSGGRDKQNILADTFEALLGGLYLSYGLEVVSTVIIEFVFKRLTVILRDKTHIDPKSKLQEIAQNKHNQTPKYTVVLEEGPDHNKLYKIGVFIGDQMLATGSGGSKQTAEQEAAKKALQSFF